MLKMNLDSVWQNSFKTWLSFGVIEVSAHQFLSCWDWQFQSCKNTNQDCEVKMIYEQRTKEGKLVGIEH